MNHQDSEIPTDESSLILFVLFELHYFMCKQESLSLSLSHLLVHARAHTLCSSVKVFYMSTKLWWPAARNSLNHEQISPYALLLRASLVWLPAIWI